MQATKVPSVDLAEEFGRELQAHQDLHNVMPPNPHTGSPSVMGLDNEKDVLETVGSDYVKSPEDIQDIKDAISVPESEIQDTEEQDVISRPAGQIAEGDDPEDVEEEVKRGHSVARQGSVFPHGLQQAEDVAASISRKLSPQDFEMLTVLGQGAFGKVSAPLQIWMHGSPHLPPARGAKSDGRVSLVLQALKDECRGAACQSIR